MKHHQTTVLYVAADVDHMLDKFRRIFRTNENIKVIKYDRPSSQTESEAAHIDLYILSIAKNAIVNCPSTFSAFAKRQRDRLEKSTDFWGIDNDQSTNEIKSDL